MTAKELLKQMTLTEKIGQLNQKLYGFSIYERGVNEEILLTEDFKKEVKKYGGLGTLYGLYRADPWSGRNYETGLHGKLAVKAYNQIQKYVIEHSRLGIPMLLSTECPHGHQALDGYLLPVNLAAGATFHPDLLQKAYKICGKQLKGMGVDLALISMLDVVRDPRWGRSEECFGEDPYLCAEFASAAVLGMQAEGVAVIAKHLAAQGEGTGGINASAARIGERELREIHLPPMKACCEADVSGVMAAYNEIDGIPCHANDYLLKDILRGEMGFDGVVMSDGVAIDQLDVMTGDNVVSGALALKSGVDIGLWDEGFGKLEEALQRGLVTEQDIDEAVLRVLTLKIERGLFEHPYLPEEEPSVYSYDKNPEALQLARESVVLLKNEEQILPFRTDTPQRIAVIGPNADALYNQLGDYTPPIRAGVGITVLKGMEEYAAKHDIGFSVSYEKGCDLAGGTETDRKKAAELASSCDVTVLVLGGSSSRFGKVSFDKNGAALTDSRITMDCGEGVDCADLELPESQRKLAEAVMAAGKKVVTVIIGGRPYAIEQIAEKSQALCLSFYPGMQGGRAIAEILFGEISPSGRLPVSVPRHSGQVPVYYNYKASYQAMNYYDKEKTPLFAFGEGLGYSHMEYEEVRLTSETVTMEELRQQKAIVKLRIRNKGTMDAYTVPMLYIRHMQKSIVPRVKELKDFNKVWIPLGEEREVSFVITEEKLSVWNSKMQFAAEPGDVMLVLCDSGEEKWKEKLHVLD